MAPPHHHGGALSRAVSEAEVTFAAEDGLPLRGIFVSPDGPGPFPAAVLVHGTAGNRSGYMREWGHHLARRGFPAFAIDTRGSDRSWAHGGRRFGAEHERLDEAPRDVAGAVDALR